MKKTIVNSNELSPKDFEELVQNTAYHLKYDYAPHSRLHDTVFRKSGLFALVKNLDPLTHVSSVRAYDRMLLQIRMATIIISISYDKNIKSKQQKLSQMIQNESKLMSNQQSSLSAYASWRLVARSTTSGLAEKAKQLTTNQKKVLCETLISFDIVNGSYDKKVQNRLEKMYEILGQDSKSVPKHIFQYIQKSSHRNKPSIKKSLIDFDTGKLKLSKKNIALQKTETSKSQKLLENIFGDVEDEEKNVHLPQSKIKSKDNYYQLFLDLTKKDTWSIPDFSELSQKHDLMFGEVIETLNDKAFELLDEPILEENGDSITLNVDIIQKFQVLWKKHR
ncbi:MAG: hypothetical protein OXC92_00685 [Flavobacteriaceae bacterium]|nr:hypothetical protein [Flavobacteriaceae bacterium]